jgi:putative membrane protein
MAPTAFSAQSGVDRLKGLALVGLILLPLVIGGLLSWSLSTPTKNLDRVTAAIVNDDVPVTVNGKSVPLGRQFAAGLISGSNSVSGSGSSSSGSSASSKSATVNNFTWILTNDKDAKTGLDSGRYAAVVTIPSSFSKQATSISGPAADAKQAHLTIVTSPASSFIDPALTEAITTAATSSLNRQLTSQYLGNVYAGFNSINQQIGQAASGASSVATGAASVSDGAQSLATGTSSLASGLQSLDSGASSLAAGLNTLSTQSQSLPSQTAQLSQGANSVAQATDSLSASLSGATASFADVVAQICQAPGPGTVCDKAQAALASLQSANTGVSSLSAGADQVATGNQQLAAAMPQLVSGIEQSAAGATQVAAGASQADSGGASVNSGAANLASGAAQVDSGAAQVSQGLDQAVQKIPTYSDSDISTLSAVVSQPVLANQDAPSPGSQSVPLFCIVALWLGGLVIALARRAVPSPKLMTSASSLSLALRSVGVDASLGAIQGLVVAALVPLALSMQPAQWLGFAAVLVVAGAVFAIVNHGLAAAFGAVGRLIAVCIGVIALSVGLASTVPVAFESLAGLFPTTPALAMVRGVLAGDAPSAWLGVGACVLFGVLGIALVFAGIAARRGVRIKSLRRVRTPLALSQ